MTEREEAPDRGTVLLLTLGYAALGLALVLAGIDASAVFLARRALSSLADGAAVAGAQGADERGLYRGELGDTLPLDPTAVAQAVSDYVAARDAATSYPGLAIAEAGTDGTTVTVTLAEDKPLPFLGPLGELGVVHLVVTARARAPVVP